MSCRPAWDPAGRWGGGETARPTGGCCWAARRVWGTFPGGSTLRHWYLERDGTSTSMAPSIMGQRGHCHPLPDPGGHRGTCSDPIPAHTHAGWLRPGLRGAAVPIPSDEMLRSNIAEDVEPSLGHGGDLLLLGSSQVLQEASSARQGQPSAGGTRGQGRWGRANHTTWHHTASTVRAGSCTKTPGTSRTTAGSIHAPSCLQALQRDG